MLCSGTNLLPKEMEFFNYCDPDLLRAMNSPVKPTHSSHVAPQRSLKGRQPPYRGPTATVNPTDMLVPGAKPLVSKCTLLHIRIYSCTVVWFLSYSGISHAIQAYVFIWSCSFKMHLCKVCTFSIREMRTLCLSQNCSSLAGLIFHCHRMLELLRWSLCSLNASWVLMSTVYMRLCVVLNLLLSMSPWFI